MNSEFKITGPGLYKRRDDSTAELVADGIAGTWVDAYTGALYYEDGHYGEPTNKHPNDIVAKLDGVGKALQVIMPPAFEIVPDRLDIATRLAVGMLAGGHVDYDSSDEFGGKHELKSDKLVNDAIALTDKLIARVKETQP